MNKFFILSFLGILLFSSCTKIEELQYGEKRPFVIYKSGMSTASPGITRLRSGELLAVFRQSTSPSSYDGKILLSCSKDEGKNWSHPDTIVTTPWDCRNPSIVQLKNGLILVSFFQSRYDTKRKELNPIGCFTVRSFDNGKTFTAPRMVANNGYDWLATSNRILELGDGTLILPAYGKKAVETTTALVVISRDGGETWKEIHLIAKDSDNRIHYKKPSLVMFPNGKIFCMMETEGGEGFLYRSISNDGAVTWSSPQSSGIFGQAPDVCLTYQGTFLCAYQDFWPMGVSFVKSYDWGRTWEKEISLFGTNDGMASPSLVEVKKGLLAVCYGCGSDIGGTFFTVKKPEVPKGVSISLSPKGQVNLRWNSVKGADYYIVYRDTTPNFVPKSGYPFKGNGIASPILPKYTDVDVDSGKTYYYCISAVCGTGKLFPNTGSESDPTEVLKVEIK